MHALKDRFTTDVGLMAAVALGIMLGVDLGRFLLRPVGRKAERVRMSQP